MNLSDENNNVNPAADTNDASSPAAADESFELTEKPVEENASQEPMPETTSEETIETVEAKGKKIKVREKKADATAQQKARIKKGRWFEPEGQLTVDVYQTEEDLVIQSAVAGVCPADLDITIEKDVVAIKGRRERPQEDRNRNNFYQECYWGSFSREIILPAEVDALRSQATLKEGVLTIRMPKIERDKKKKLVIRPG